MKFSGIKAIVFGLIVVFSLITVMVFMLWLGKSSNSIEVKLGDDDFRNIDAKSLALEIADEGPVLFPDLLGRDRPIWVTHVGNDPATGWFAFLARIPQIHEKCFVEWDKHIIGFISTCKGKKVYPPNGDGLEQLNWKVVNQELRIMINTGSKSHD